MDDKLKQAFDTAAPEELDALVQSLPLPELPTGVRPAKIQAKAMEKAGIPKKKQPAVFPWKPIAALAACFCLILGAALGLSKLGSEQGTTPSFSAPGADAPGVHDITQMLNTFSPDKIIWSQTPEAPETPDAPDIMLSVQQWNGLNVTAELLSALSADDGTGLFAVGLVCVPQQGEFQSFVYREMTGTQLLNEEARLTELSRQLLVLAELEDPQIPEDRLTQLQQQVESKLLDHYRTPEGLDLDAIAADNASTQKALKDCATLLSNAKEAYLQSRSVSDLSVLATEGYYVVESKGNSYLIVSAQDLIRLSGILDDMNRQGKFIGTAFRLIRPKQLGLISNNGILIPGDDNPDESVDITLPIIPPPDAEISPIRPGTPPVTE